MKPCTDCGVEKDTDMYGSIGYGKRRAQCRICYNAQMKVYYRSLPFRKRKDISLRRTFGITIEEYDALLAEQNGVCFVCKKRDKNFSLCVDHNHATGAVRGLLCNPCNRALGLLKESIPNLLSMVEYIRLYEGDF